MSSSGLRVNTCAENSSGKQRATVVTLSGGETVILLPDSQF